MRLLIFIYAFISVMSASAGTIPSVYGTIDEFNNCCSSSMCVLKILERKLITNNRYLCVNHEVIGLIYNISITQSDLLKGCGHLQIVIDKIEAAKLSKTLNNLCHESLVTESANDTTHQNITTTITLICKHTNKTDGEIPKLKQNTNYNRKCCPKEQVYDTKYHVCRKNHIDSNNKYRIDKSLANDYIYEIDTGNEYGIKCKADEFSVELPEEMFLLRAEDGTLDVKTRSGEKISRVLQGNWCVDHRYSNSNLVARICTKNCTAFGAFCIRKCCPVGEHYGPERTCILTTDDRALFDISSYLKPVVNNYNDFKGVIGIGTKPYCSEGLFELNRSLKDEQHWLTREGLLESPNIEGDGHQYCLETIDNGENAVVTALRCIVYTIPDDYLSEEFILPFVLNSISSVCLALTLLVYCTLPELRNLHGRNIICHVSMMLLAYSCLAGIQYRSDYENIVCIMLGYGVYVGFVAAFIWLNVMCFDIWRTFGCMYSFEMHPFRRLKVERRRFAWYSLYAWSLVGVLVTTVLLLDFYPLSNFLDANMGDDSCWFGSSENVQSKTAYYVFFVTPMGILTCTNFVLWVLTARHCVRVKSEVHRLQVSFEGNRAKRRFSIDKAKYILTGKLWVVMGASWALELVSTLLSEPEWFWYVVDTMNELQGMFIFLILVFKPKVYRLIKKKIGLQAPNMRKSVASSSARTSFTVLLRTISTDERTDIPK